MVPSPRRTNLPPYLCIVGVLLTQGGGIGTIGADPTAMSWLSCAVSGVLCCIAGGTKCTAASAGVALLLLLLLPGSCKDLSFCLCRCWAETTMCISSSHLHAGQPGTRGAASPKSLLPVMLCTAAGHSFAAGLQIRTAANITYSISPKHCYNPHPLQSKHTDHNVHCLLLPWKFCSLYSTLLARWGGMCTSGGILCCVDAAALGMPSCVIHLLLASAGET
jgi:hypothetical protein